MMIMPSARHSARVIDAAKRPYAPSPAEAMSSPAIRVNMRIDASKLKHAPLGENLTTFTAAECLLSVARYST